MKFRMLFPAELIDFRNSKVCLIGEWSIKSTAGTNGVKIFGTTGTYNIRLMELRRVLNFSTRYSVGVGDFLILQRSEFFFLILGSIAEFIQGI